MPSNPSERCNDPEFKAGNAHRTADCNKISEQKCLSTKDSAESKTHTSTCSAKTSLKLQNEDWIKKEPYCTVQSSRNLDPIAVDLSIDRSVSGNKEGENDIAGRPTPFSTSAPEMEARNDKSGNTTSDCSSVECESSSDAEMLEKSYTEEDDVIQTQEQTGKDLPKHRMNFESDVKYFDKVSKGDFICGPSRSVQDQYHNREFQTSVEQDTNNQFYENVSDSSSSYKDLETDINIDSFKCDQCPKSFGSKKNLHRHMKRHDRQVFSYMCGVCNKNFHQKSNLLTHIRTHTGEKPFKCDLCDQGFSQKSNLLTHIKTHSSQGDQKFLTNSELAHSNEHEREKLFKCDQCTKSFCLKSYLDRHIKTHSSDNRFSCDYCEKKFSRKCNLLSHLRRHTGEKPFSCDQCGRKFSQKCNLLTHQKKQMH